MFRAAILGIALAMTAFSANADTPLETEVCDESCLFETIWSQAERLEPRKLNRLIPVFLETVALTENPELLRKWEVRIGDAHEPAEEYEDYALGKVSRFIAAEGWDAFFSHAQTRTYPLNSGRPEMMAAAAEHIADGETASKIYALMETLGNRDRSEAAFERASFGHALVEAAMRRCDLEGFDRVLQMTDAPDNIRYAFWRTRMVGSPSSLKQRIIDEFDPENSASLRQALDGYGDVLKRGKCLAADQP